MYVRAHARAVAGCAGATIVLALAPRPLELAVLAATAGTLFEAAPFVLLARLLPSRVRSLARLAACGCGGPGELPGALAPVAVALCWLSFGPAVALARAAAAALPAVVRGPRAAHANGDAFAALWGAAASSAATALVAPRLGGLAAEPALAAIAGMALGVAVPCASAGVAVAAGCASRDPWLAAGILTTTGIVPRVRFPGRGPSRVETASAALSRTPRDGRFALLLFAAALALLVVRDGAGFVNPRLVPFAGAAAALAVARAFGPAFPAALRTAALPAVMLGALIAGSPEPPYVADETDAQTGFPGEPVTFTGTAHAAGAATRLVRFAITCCRLDATALALTLDRRLTVRDGTWLRVRGRFVLRDGRLVVHPDASAAVPKPPDPFVYR